MIKLSLQQALVLQKFANDMQEMHDAVTPEEEEVFAHLDAAIDCEKDKNLVAKNA